MEYKSNETKEFNGKTGSSEDEEISILIADCSEDYFNKLNKRKENVSVVMKTVGGLKDNGRYSGESVKNASRVINETSYKYGLTKGMLFGYIDGLIQLSRDRIDIEKFIESKFGLTTVQANQILDEFYKEESKWQ